MSNRIHIFGASGAGTTTLGYALARELSIQHLDIDDFYWRQTNPPFEVKRSPEQRRRRLQCALDANDAWVLTGSLCGWGDVFVSRFTLAIYVDTASDVRLTRLRARECDRYGWRIAPKGDMHAQHVSFLEWAMAYDDADEQIRSQRLHDRWSRELPCVLIRVDGTQSIDRLVCESVGALQRSCSASEHSQPPATPN